jgi:hypothetical protein
MNQQTYEKLMKELDELESKLQNNTHPVPSSAEASNGASTEFLSENTDINSIPEQRLPLVHTLLHMFYTNNNGRDLTPKSIEKLHKEVTKKLKSHSAFDRLDYRG